MKSRSVAAVLIAAAVAVLASAEESVRPLSSGTSIRDSVAAGEKRSFSFVVPAGTAARVTVSEESVDVEATLTQAGAAARAARVETSNGVGGSEVVIVPISDAPASWILTVEAAAAQASRGDYSIVLETDIADEAARERAAAHFRLMEAYSLHGTGKGDSIRKAVTMYDEVQNDAARLGDRRLQAEATYQAARALDLLGEWPTAIEYQLRALPVVEALQLRGRTSRVLDRLGDMSRKTGDVVKAEEYLAAALPIAREVRDVETEADILNNTGLLFSSMGRWEEAVGMLESAIPLAQKTESLDVEAALHHNLGQAFGNLGDYPRAIEAYERALVVKRKMGSPRRMASTLNNLAVVYFSTGQSEKALSTMMQAIAFWEESGDRAGLANSIASLARMKHEAGDTAAAIAAFEKSIPILQEVRNRAGEGTALATWASIDLDSGQAEAALEKLSRALTLAREAADRRNEARVLYLRAKALDKAGQLAEAIASAEASIALVENMREAMSRREFRDSYLSIVRSYYDLLVDLLLRQENEEGVKAAFTAGERARARTLLESLAESAAKIRKGIDPALRRREREVQAALNAKEMYRARQAPRRGNEAVERATAEVNALLEQLRDVQAEIRSSSPQYAALKMPEPVSVETVQRSLLDSDSVLLSFHLGEENSHAWVIDRKSISVHALPAAKAIDDLARRYHEALSQQATASRSAEVGKKLAEMIFRPVSKRVRGKRLLIVPDGALHYVPFAALPSPATGEPLIAEHEIVYLPSASVMQSIQREQRSGGPMSVAVFADPVFNRDDPRLNAAATERTASARSAGFQRLRFSRGEASAIVAAAADSKTFEAVGFDASKRTLLDTDLRRYDILHFATHGALDTEHPELSGLVFSLFNREGRTVDGFLRLHEIYNLDLDARLVVLSACKTALGKEVHGEGLIGLTRGFLYAGAAGIVSTVWNIDDRASAQLMSRFYEAMLRDGLRPADALRKAQLSMLSQPRWRDPHYWAAFGIHGEWR